MKTFVLILALTFFGQTQAPVTFDDNGINNVISIIKDQNMLEVGKDFGYIAELIINGDLNLKNTEDVKAFLKGLLIGIFGQDIAGQVVECLDAPNIEAHIQQAIKDFEKKTVEGIKEGAIELGALFKALPAAILNCLKDHYDVALSMIRRVKLILSYIENPILLGEKVLVNLFKHGITIFKDIEHGVQAMKTGNYIEAGKDFGEALTFSIFGFQAYQEDLANSNEFMKGWLIGVFNQDIVGEVAECLNLQDLIMHVDNALYDFKKKTTFGIEEGLVELLDVFLSLPNAIDTCLSEHSDVAADIKLHVTTIITYIKDPSTLGPIVAKNVLRHGITIFKDIDDSFAAIKSSNWEQAGTDFGDAIDLALFGQLGDDNDQVKAFLKGMIEGFFYQNIVEDLTECMDIQSIEQHLVNTINELQKFTMWGIMDGGKDLLSIYNELKQSVAKCMSGHNDIKQETLNKIEIVKQIISDPSQLQSIVIKNIEKYEVTIYKDLRDILSSFETNNWNKAGIDFGQFIDLILFGGGQVTVKVDGVIDDVKVFTKGLLVGLIRDQFIDTVTDCMNFEDIEQHIINAYNDFKKFDLQGFLDGFNQLLAVYTETKTAAINCLQDHPEVQQAILNKIEVMEQIIKDPSQLEKIVMSNLQTYALSVIFDLKDAEYAIMNKDWYQAGHDIGDIVNCLLFGNKLVISNLDIKNFIRGWLQGIFQEDVAALVSECLNLNDIKEHLYIAFTDFKKLDVEGQIQGMQEIFKVYEHLPTAIDECMVEHQDIADQMIEKIEKVRKRIADIDQTEALIKKNFFENSLYIIRDLYGCTDYLTSGDFRTAGKELGEICNLLLFGSNFKIGLITLDNININQFVKGWLIGVFKEDVAGEMVECLQVDVIYQHIQLAFADFKQFNIQGLEDGAMEILEIFKLIPSAIDQCMTEHQNVAENIKAKITEILAIAQDPSQLLTIMEQNAFQYGYTISKDVTNALSDILNQNWLQAGIDLGDAVNLLIFGGNVEDGWARSFEEVQLQINKRSNM